jgi:hypothetical protein
MMSLLADISNNIPMEEDRFSKIEDFDTKWRTFDQIIFSSAFLEQSEWQLNENYTQILQFQPFNDFVSKANEIFAHLPVIGVIEREGTNG